MGKKRKQEPPPHVDCPEAPVFRPTAEEWKDPLRYIAEVIRPLVEHTSGICRVVPPADWVAGLAESFAIDRATLKFNARVQRVDQLQQKHTAVASQRFWNEYQAWMAANGVKRKGGKLNPVFGGKEVELDRLHAIVQRRGGYDAVTEERGWREVANVLDLDDKSGNAAFSLRKLYEKLLRPFDEYCGQRAEGGYGLLAAAMTAEELDTTSAAAVAAQAHGVDMEGLEEDEAAEILSAMLGLGPPGSAKKAKGAVPGVSPVTAAKAPPSECEKCRGGHAADKLVQCDRCAKGWHMFCLSPPLAARPARDWVCPECRAKEFEAFAFQDADDYTLEEFESIAATFEEQWFGENALAKLSDKDKEAEFWRIVEEAEDVVEVLYGADLDSVEVGSGFPRSPPLGNSDSPYATDPWNLSVMPRQAGLHSSLLRVLDGHIAGVTVPWVYVGMCFSSFCWHVEDHMFYSINYNHWGAPKQWYGVPAWAAAKFEAVFQKELADQVAAQPDLLFQLLSMVSPRVLRQHGLPVHAATQAAGEFVITFPNAYHCGFSMGVNLGEAVNFAPPDWLRFGAAALGRLRYFRKPCVASQEEMLLRVAAQQGARAAAAAKALPAPGGEAGQGQEQGEQQDAAQAGSPPGTPPGGKPSPLLCYYLQQELRRVVDEEWVLRCKLWSEGLRRSRRTALAVGFQEGDADDAECAICHLYMHLSAVECDCCKGRRVCLHHAANLCGCPMSQRRLVYRHSLAQLEGVHAAVAERVTADMAAELDDYEAASSSRTAAASAANVEACKQESERRQQQQQQLQAQQQAQQQEQQAQQQEQQEQQAAAPEAGEEKPAAAQEAQEQALPEADAAVAEVKVEVKAEAEGSPAAAAGEAPAAPAGDGGEQAQQQAQAPAPLLVKSNVPQQEGPVRPFVSVDVCPWDRAEVPEWQDALRTACQQWQTDALHALQQGGLKSEVLEELAEESEQYLWGDVSPEVAELAGRVQVAAAYMARLGAALKGRLTMDEVEALLSEDPCPVPEAPGVPKLKEGLQQAQDWLERSKEFVDEARVVDFKALDAIASEASRIPVLLPEAQSLRDRAAAARRLADAVRGVLPTARGEGRRRGSEQMDVEDLLDLQRQAAALHVDMPERASLALALERVEVWQSRVRALTEMQAPLDELRELVEEADSLPAAMPEAEDLRMLIDRAEAWQAQLEGILRGRVAVKRLREMLNTGTRLGVDMPQLEGLRHEIRRREWEDQARRSLGARQNTLASLLELLSSASEVDAEQGQLAQSLRERVEVAEAWEARAADLLERQTEGVPEGKRPSLQAVHQLASEGYALGLKMDRLTLLNNELMRAINWMEDARATLSKAATAEASQGAAAGAGSAATGANGTAGAEAEPGSEEGDEDGQSMAPSGTASLRGTPEPEASAVAAALLAAAEVQQHAPVQAAGASQPLLPALPSLPGVVKARRRGRQPKAKGAKGGKEPSRLPELSVIEELLEQYKTLLVRADEEAEGLRRLRSQADDWLEEARPVLEQEFVTDEQLGRLEGLIAGGERVGLAMEQVEILKANVEALLWARKVRALFARLPRSTVEFAQQEGAKLIRKQQLLLQQQQAQQQAGGVQAAPEAMDVDQQQQHQAEQQQAGQQAADAAQSMQQEGQQAGEAASQEEGSQPGADLSGAEVEREEEEAVRQLATALPGLVEREEERCGVAASVETLPFEHRLPLSEFTALIEEGYILPCDEKLWAQLRSVVEAAQDFNSRATHVLALGRDGVSFAHLIEAADLQRLLLRADLLSMKLEHLPILQAMLAAFRQWEQGMQALMQDAGDAPVKPGLAAVAAASATAKGLPITSPLRAMADEAVTKTAEWQERLRRMLAKRNTGAKLDAVLGALAQSVDAAVDQFERRLDAEKALVIAGANPATVSNVPPPPGAALQSNEVALYCMCQRGLKDDPGAMIPCDSCKEWYHGRCIGLTQTQMRATRRYICPLCTAIKGNTEPLEAALVKLQRTKRPDREELASLLPDLEALPVQPEEGRLLGQILRKFDRWRTATNRAIEVHEMSRTVEHAGSILQLSQGMLYCLLKSSLALEIESIVYADKVLRVLRCNTWREQVEAAMVPPAKLGMDGLARILIEGEKLLGHSPTTDVTGAKVLAAMQSGREWAQRAEALAWELQSSRADEAKFKEAAGRAKGLAKEAEGLGVRMQDAVDRLMEHAKLHCLCQQPSYDRKLMVGCNHCKEWFHHKCVGLKAPGSGSEGDEAPEAFRCPLCCMRMGVKYAHFHNLPAASLDALKEAALKLPPAPPPAPAAPPKPAPRPRAAPKPAMPAFPAGWPALPAMAATMAAAGIRPGMIPSIPGMTPEQLTSALTQMFQAGVMPAGVMMPAGGNMAMLPVPPQLLAMLQKQQAAALAQRAVQEQKAKAAAKNPGEGEQQQQDGSGGAKEGQQQQQGAAGTAAGAAKPPRKRKKAVAQDGEVKPEQQKAAKGDKAADGKPAPKRRKPAKQQEPAEQDGKPPAEGSQKEAKEGGKQAKEEQAAAGGGGKKADEAAGAEGKPAKSAAGQKRRSGRQPGAAEGSQPPEQQADEQQQQQQQQPAAEEGEEGAGGSKGAKRRRASRSDDSPPSAAAAGGGDAPQEAGAAPAAGAGEGDASSGGKPAAKRKKADKGGEKAQVPAQQAQQAQQEGVDPAQLEEGQPAAEKVKGADAAVNGADTADKADEPKPTAVEKDKEQEKEEDGKGAAPAAEKDIGKEAGANKPSAAGRRRSSRHAQA